jgi:hypothetical protein
MTFNRISFCISCMNSLFELQGTLLKNIQDNKSYPNLEFVLLGCNDNDKEELQQWLQSHLQQYIQNGLLVYYKNPAPAPIGLAHASNMVCRLAGGDILCCLEPDQLTGANFALHINQQMNLASTTSGFFPLTDTEQPNTPKRTAAVVIRQQDLRVTGGYSEEIADWQTNQQDFIRRLNNSNLPCNPAQIPAAPSGGSSQMNPPAVIANFGQFGCGTVYKNFIDKPIVLAPFPIRIFGIGWHKTATTSLAAAMTILGFKSKHFPYNMYLEIIAKKQRFFDVEQNYMLCDLPLAPLFKELDQAYPGSKFILSKRDTPSWLNSIKHHFALAERPHESGMTQGDWVQKTSYGHSIHELAYGRRDFDETTCRLRYEQHNREVLAYFKDRPGDLLIMDITQELGWLTLCDFLDVPVPEVSYPQKYRTKDRM